MQRFDLKLFSTKRPEPQTGQNAKSPRGCCFIAAGYLKAAGYLEAAGY